LRQLLAIELRNGRDTLGEDAGNYQTERNSLVEISRRTAQDSQSWIQDKLYRYYICVVWQT